MSVSGGRPLASTEPIDAARVDRRRAPRPRRSSPWRPSLAITREWVRAGARPGLQNRWRGARRRAVGSTPMRSRQAARSTACPTSSHQPATEDGPDWAAYYRHTLGREPRPLFAKGMAALEAAGVAPGQAVEIGFGDGTETLTLLAAGWRVLAIDPAPEAAEVLRGRRSRARTQTVSRSAPNPPRRRACPPFDLLYAGYALSFIRPTRLPRLLASRPRRAPAGRIPRRQRLRRRATRGRASRA